MVPSSACESCAARLMIVASTVSRSSEELTARSTSSSACSSPTERVSSSVRVCNSSSSRAFSIAMTAWSAKVRTSSICRSVNGCTRFRPRLIVPRTAPSRSSGTPRQVPIPAATVSGSAKSGSAAKSATCTTLPSSATGDAVATWDNGSLAQDRPILGVGCGGRHKAVDLALAYRNHCEIGAAKPDSRLDHCVEGRLHIGGRAADHVEHLAGRGLVFERLFEVARAGLQLAEQPRILDRDDRLVGKGAHQLDLPLSEQFDPFP